MKIYINQIIRGCTFFPPQLVAKPGIHEAKFNQYGAVSVEIDGRSLGVKLDEFLFLSKEDREEWLKIAHPNIPEIKENDGVKFDKEFTNLGELFIFYLKKYNLGNQNKYSAIMEVKKKTRVFLQQKITISVKDLRMFEKQFDLVDDVYPKNRDLHRANIKKDIERVTTKINVYEDLGKGVIDTKHVIR